MKMLRMTMSLGLVLGFGIALGVGCGSAPKNHPDGYHPAGINCITPTDPDCVGTATAGVSVPIPRSKKELNAIIGRCELIVENETEPRPCSGLKLVLRADRENISREAEIDGYKIVFPDLQPNSTYRLTGASELYDIQTDTKALAPGQNVKIRVKAKSRP